MQANELEAQDYQNDYVAGQIANLSVDMVTLRKDFRHLLTEHLIPIQSHRSPCQCADIVPTSNNPQKRLVRIEVILLTNCSPEVQQDDRVS